MAALGGAGPARACRRRAACRRAPRRRRGARSRVTPVAARGDADDRFAHQAASASGMAATRSSAIIAGPGDLGGAAVEPDRGAGGFERRHARARAAPRSFRRARRRCPRWPARPAPAARSRGGRRARRPACRAPCRRSPRRDCRAASSARSALLPVELAEQSLEFALVRGEDRVMPVQPLRLADQRRWRRRRSPSGALAVSASVSSCGMSPMPGPDQDGADPRVVDDRGVGLDDRRGQAVDRPRRADPDIAGARRAPRRCAASAIAPGILPARQWTSPRLYLWPAGSSGGSVGRADLEPVAARVDADVGEHDAAACAPSPASAGARASARRR